MHPRYALLLFSCCAWLCGSLLLASAAGAAGDVPVYGLELEVDEERERLLIFAEAPLEPELIEVDERTTMVALPGSVLDPSAPTRLSPAAQGTVVRVTAFERADASAAAEVRIVVQHRPGAVPLVERRGSVIALDFEPLRRPSRPEPEDLIQLAGRRKPIRQLVTSIASFLDEIMIFDDAVSGLGTVTIEGPGRLTRGEARALLDSILLLKGFAAVSSPGGARKIVPISGAPSPWSPSGELADSDAPVTTVLRLETAKAAEILTVLTPYLGAYSTGVAFEPTNSLILAGPASRLRRLRTAVEGLDAIETGRPVFWPLEYADAETVAEQIREMLGSRDAPYASGDTRTNTLLLRVRPESLERARALVDRLDRPEQTRGEFQVIGLRYADPASLAERLLALRDDAPTAAEFDPTSRRGGLRGIDFHVVADTATRALVVRSSPEDFASIRDVVRELDRTPPSVRIEVTVATITVDNRLDLGFDAFIPTLTNPKAPDDLIVAVTSNPSGGGIQQLPSATRPFVASFVRAPLLLTLLDPITGQPFVLPPIPRESFSITLNDREVYTDTLMRPQLLVVSGEEHEVFSGDNVPVRVAQTEPGLPTQVRQNIERYDVGTSLRVTPTVGAEGAVSLDLALVVSSLSESQAGPIERVGPSIREVEVQTKVRLRHGELAVVATAVQPIVQHTETGIPWLKDIPWLGFAFRTTTDQAMDRYLLVAVQAELLRPELRELARALAEELGPMDPSQR